MKNSLLLNGTKATITPIIQMRINIVIVLHFLGLKNWKGYTMQMYFSTVRNVKSNTDTSVERMAKDPVNWHWKLSIHICACLLYSPRNFRSKAPITNKYIPIRQSAPIGISKCHKFREINRYIRLINKHWYLIICNIIYS